MLSKISSTFSKAPLLKVSRFSASDIKKFDYKDALNFQKLLTEEEIMVEFNNYLIISKNYFLDNGASKPFFAEPSDASCYKIIQKRAF